MKHGEMAMSVENIGGISCYLPAYYLHIERVAAGANGASYEGGRGDLDMLR